MRRGLVVAVLLCLGGAALLLLATSRTWLTLRFGAAPPLPGRVVAATGDDLVPGVRALALLGLAGVAALPATRSWGRLAVGVVLSAAGGLAGALLVRCLLDTTAAAQRTEALRSDLHFTAAPDLGGWPYVGLLGAALLLAAGALTVVRGRSWSALGSSYDAPTAAAPAKEPSVWDALDRGVDPTA
jgi:uncharacterized membrane protein (TIGR02234 family)